ncbi:hypothetical protein chiPu_0010785 [Chiloscyllium punctatum]|uniref:Uncharacterized protein n=1 Tax=Chiloscyllium punctatum TaxID=137246 RepID=A0A401SPK1_CHIPU|nr:hypothetical protein [Chiloscyllium punctatum]
MDCTKVNVLSLILATVVLTVLFLPDMLEANVLRQLFKGDVDEQKVTVESKEATNFLSKLTRSKRHTKQFQQDPDFWNAYQHFLDIGFNEGVYEMDKVYLHYLQDKSRDQSHQAYQAYMQRLREEECDTTKDPDCQPTLPHKQAAYTQKQCDPYTDPYCRAAGYSCDPQKDPYYPECYSRYRDREQERTASENCDPYTDPECYSQYRTREQERTASENCDPYTDPECYSQYRTREQERTASENCDPHTDPECYYSLYRARQQERTAPENCDSNVDPYCDSSQSQVHEEVQNRGATEGCDPNYDSSCQKQMEFECNPDNDPNCGNQFSQIYEQTHAKVCDPYDPYCSGVATESHQSEHNCNPDYDPDCHTSQPHDDDQKHKEDCDPYHDSNCRNESEDLYEPDSDCDFECRMQRFAVTDRDVDFRDTSRYEIICDPDLEIPCPYENDINDVTTSYDQYHMYNPYSAGYEEQYQSDQEIHHKSEIEDDSEGTPKVYEEGN